MEDPALVRDCVQVHAHYIAAAARSQLLQAMRDAVDIPVTVKCRLGVDQVCCERKLAGLSCVCCTA